jgi:hypothetical protein
LHIAVCPPCSSAGADVVCPVQLINNGQLTLPSITLTTTGASATTLCSPATPTLAPGARVNCTLTAPAGQNEYDAGTLQLQVEATADPLGPVATTLSGTLLHSPSVTLNNSASMDVTVQGTGAISKAGEHCALWVLLLPLEGRQLTMRAIW